MKELFKELETLKPEKLAKVRLQQRMEENQMKKSSVITRIWKPVMIGVFVLGVLCIPLVQDQLGGSIQVSAKEVDKLNLEIEQANESYIHGDISYGDYQVIVDDLVKSRDDIVNEIHSQHPDYEITLIEKVDENKDPVIEVMIEEK